MNKRKKSRSSKAGRKSGKALKTRDKTDWGKLKKHRLKFDSEEFLVYAIPDL